MIKDVSFNADTGRLRIVRDRDRECLKLKILQLKAADTPSLLSTRLPTS